MGVGDCAGAVMNLNRSGCNFYRFDRWRSRRSAHHL